MGLFHHKQQPQNTSQDGDDSQAHFFDEYYREELRNHGRWYFEKVIKENGELFKKDLEATVTQINAELKDHVTRQLDEAITKLNTELKDHFTQQLDAQFSEYSKTMKDAQDSALQSMTRSSQELQDQHHSLSETLQKTIADQDAMLHTAFEDSKAHITAMQDAQNVALQSLNSSAQAVQDQYKQLSETLQKNVADQEARMVKAFEDHMAETVEHYLLGALGDQYDLKAQLPSIIKQLEANKQAMVDDINL